MYYAWADGSSSLAELAEQVSKMVEQSQPKQTIRADGPPTLLSDYRFTHT